MYWKVLTQSFYLKNIQCVHYIIVAKSLIMEDSFDEEGGYPYSESDLDMFMEEAKKLVIKAAEIIKSGIGKTKAISQVDLKDFNVSEGNASAVLTETDVAVEKLIIDGLREIFPDHCFIGEEGIGAEFPGKVN